MTNFDITILGSNSAIFNHGRHPTAQVVTINNIHFLVDCGEGTQERLHENKIKWFKIDYILISHLHGDHYYGLIGLLTTFNLLKRKNKLTIFGPKDLKKIIDLQLKVANTKLNYELRFETTKDDEKRLLLDLPECLVYSFPLKHKLPTTGFLFTEKNELRQLNLEKLKKYSIAKTDFKLLKQGFDVLDKTGRKVKNSNVTTKGKQQRSYAFCSDTMYHLPLVKMIKNVDVLYHEATFLHEDLQRAVETTHSTAKQAGQIAKKVNAKKLLLGHFSSRYIDLSVLQNEAKTTFENVELAIEGEVFTV
ncbi:MAG: ribonuclease Z [Chitinophagales bacterium]